jgi:hypothetical protein
MGLTWTEALIGLPLGLLMIGVVLYFVVDAVYTADQRSRGRELNRLRCTHMDGTGAVWCPTCEKFLR